MGVRIYKCPNCGGELTFDPAGQKYRCEYCQSEFTQEEIEGLASSGSEETTQWDETGTAGAVYYSCPNCGAQIITDETTAATFCYYCHNPVVLEGRLSGEFLPDRILPFQISREKAIETFRDNISRKWFVPKAFFNEEQIEKLTGIYYPYWVYNCSIDGKLEGTGTKVRVFRSGDTEVTETSIYGVSREGKIGFEDLTRNALLKTDRQLVENVQPFSLKEMKDFSMGYLSGFQAEKRDQEKEVFTEELRDTTAGYAFNILRDSAAGYSTFTTNLKEFQTEKEEWQYVLLPVWVLTYAGLGGKIYYYAMNGQNGNVYGAFPIDWKKLSLFSLGIFAAVTILALIGGYFIW